MTDFFIQSQALAKKFKIRDDIFDLEGKSFQGCLKLDKIEKAVPSAVGGRPWYLMTWKRSKKISLVPGKVAEENCASELIKFLQERITFND